ncbi:DapH/DapD/GlmU-related protein [Synechococcus sp. CBW1108]|uniref:DapH/DapD/GlmU-related protein n=1 Tax=Synechococcus sp. CBW1108 TaxID=1353147 RepID=UPI0018CED791|nr:putative colanic acid biosynthesis acetyltransferase [Synechococcus sp. CBW1108]
MPAHLNLPPRGTSPWTRKQRLGLLTWEITWSLLCAWTPKPLNRWRLLILRLFGAKVECTPFVHQRARIQVPWNLTLGSGASLGDRSNIYSLDQVIIGRRVVIGQESYLCTGTHDLSTVELPLVTAPIIVDYDTFIGARVFVMPGVKIGCRSVVGACSVVTRDVSPDTVVAGNPARPLSKT